MGINKHFSQSLFKLMSIESVRPPNHLILWHSLLLLLSVLPSIRVFFSESALHIRWPKYWSFSFSISPSNEYSGWIFLRIACLALLAVQGTLRSLLQHHSSKASILWRSAFFTVQLSHLYMNTEKTIALTRWIFELCRTQYLYSKYRCGKNEYQCRCQFFHHELSKDPMRGRRERLRDLGSGKELVAGRGWDGGTIQMPWDESESGGNSWAVSIRIPMSQDFRCCFVPAEFWYAIGCYTCRSFWKYKRGIPSRKHVPLGYYEKEVTFPLTLRKAKFEEKLPASVKGNNSSKIGLIFRF